MTDVLRVLDLGKVDALRSQTLWHAIAAGVSTGVPATLSFLRPTEPYVCIGFHRRVDEVDLDECRRRALPVYRRMVGGGPVYLDDGQLFFQITVPSSIVPPMRTTALRRLLAPAVGAFRAAGVDAEFDDTGEIVVGDRKVCGHAAAQIDGAVVVVGNVIERFDHAAAAAVLRAPSPAARVEVLRLMRRYVSPTAVDERAFRDAAIEAYADGLGLSPRPGALTAIEEARRAELDRRFTDPAWIIGPERPVPPAWQVKIRAGVWVVAAGEGPTSVLASVIDGRIDRAVVTYRDLNGDAAAAGAALAGHRLVDARAVLARFGEPGDRVAALLEGSTAA